MCLEGELRLVGPCEREERMVWRSLSRWVAMREENVWQDESDKVFPGCVRFRQNLVSIRSHPSDGQSPGVHRRVQRPAFIRLPVIPETLPNERVNITMHTSPFELRIVLPIILHHHHPNPKHNVH